MSRTLSRRFAVVLVLALLVGMAATGLASQPAWAEHGHGEGNNQGHDEGQSNNHFSNSFGDISFEDYPWAFKHIEKMAAKGFIKGVGNGCFNGNAEIKHEEAVIMIVRYLGLESEAQAAMNATLPLSDAKSIDSWARGYVKVALDKNLLWMPDASQMTRFDPKTPTTRVEAVVMLVKAAGLEADAKAKMTQALTFKDAATIPAAYVGYVAVGVEKGLVKGYDDNTFQPFKPVKRAEMATFLGRTDETFPHHGDDNEVEGKLVSTTATTITVESEHEQGTFTLAANCPVYLNDELATLTDLTAGDKVELELDAQDNVIFIDAERDDEHGTPSPVTSAAGVVKGLTVGTTSSITILPDNQTANVTYDLAANCVVKINGTVSSLAQAQIVVGDTVQLKLTAGKVSEIDVIREQTSTVTGTVQAISVNTGSNSIITVLPNGETSGTSYLLATNVTVKYVDHVVPLSEVKVGDKVTLTLTNPTQLPLVMQVVIANRETVTDGTVTGISYDARTLTIIKDSVTTSYTVSPTAVVTLLGQAFTWDEVALSDGVTLTVVNNTVTKIDVTVHNAVYTGAVKSVTIDATGNHFVATISGVDRTVDVPATAVITQNGQPATFGVITAGATVTITGAFDGSTIVAAQIIIQ